MRGWGKQRKVLRKHDWEFCVLKLTHLGRASLSPVTLYSTGPLQTPQKEQPHSLHSPGALQGATMLQSCKLSKAAARRRQGLGQC